MIASQQKNHQKNIIMDTHIFYWYVNQDTDKVSKTLQNQLDNADNLYVSTASCFELAWLVAHNRIIFDTPYLEWYDMVRQYTDINFLDITPNIMHTAVNLPEHHKDPWDRIITQRL